MAPKTLPRTRATKPAAASKSGLTATIVTVTPKLAGEWMESNEKNRHIRDRLVVKYARDMSAGNWSLTGEAIKFDTEGCLVDGQHRLLAVILSGVSLQMLVVCGVERAAQTVMDTGAST
jgi:hypothetical protein